MDASYLNGYHSHPLTQSQERNWEISIMLLRIFTSHFISEQDIKTQLHFPRKCMECRNCYGTHSSMCDVVPPEIYALSFASCFSKKGRDKVCESNVLWLKCSGIRSIQLQCLVTSHVILREITQWMKRRFMHKSLHTTN